MRRRCHESHDGGSKLATDRYGAIVGSRCTGSPVVMDLAREGHKIAGKAGPEVREGFTVTDDRNLIWLPKGHHLVLQG